MISVFAAVVLCFLPLTSILGYESSAVMGVVLGIAAMRLTAIELQQLSSRARTLTTQEPLRWWLDRLGPRLLVSVPPGAVLLLNALRVQNCDPLAGVAFWFLIPVVSILVGHALVFVLHRCTGSARWAFRIALAVAAADTIWFAARLVFEPPITGMHLLFGYFAGSIYDEALSVPEPLLWYRLLVVLSSIAMVLAVQWAAKRRTGQPTATALWAVCATTTVAAVIGWNAESLGFWLDREAIAEELGASVESEHFLFFYDPSALNARQIAQMIDDHEYRYAELQAFFDEDPVQNAGRRLRSFIYPSRDTQQRLFGSRNTFVARPWSYEMHIRWSKPGSTAVAHELAHLFTTPFGGGPLSLATEDGTFVHLGLVEGIALAADWPPSELTPHEAASAMRALDIAPDLRILFEPSGFWSQPSGKAYTLMGSFVRWLVDTRGIEAFKKVYAYGDWEGTYQQSTDALVAEWEAFVDQYQIDQSRLELARFKYSRNTIFKKVCARSIAELKRRADNAKRRGDYTQALALQQEILGFQQGTPEPGLEIARLLVDLEQWEEAQQLVDELRNRTGRRALKPRTRAVVEQLRADILWQADQQDAAAEGYRRCLGWGLSDAERRTLTLKLFGTTTDDTDTRTFVFDYIFASDTRSQYLWTARNWAAHTPDDPLVRYLLGYQLTAARMPGEAIDYLAGPPGTLSTTELDEQRQILLARALSRTGQFDDARSVWEHLLNAHSSRTRLLAAEGVDRVRFAQGESLPTHTVAP